MSATISDSRAVWLMTRLRALRLLNVLGTLFRKKTNATGQRQATAGKQSTSWMLGAFVGCFMLGSFANLSYTGLASIQRHLGGDGAAPGSRLAGDVMRGAMLELSLLFVFALLGALGSKELAQPDWDLEWLVTLPVRLPALVVMRIVERTVVNPWAILTLWPFLTVLGLRCGQRWSAPVIGLGLTVLLSLVTAIIRTVVDTGLRVRLSPPRLRNLQATLAILAPVALYLAMSTGMQQSYVIEWAPSLPDWVPALPPGLAVRIVASASPTSALGAVGLLAGQAVCLCVLGFALLRRQLQGGVTASGARESSRHTAPRRAIAVAVAESAGGRPTRAPFWTPIQRRELRLLGRDRNFLVQTIGLPILIIGAQIFIFNRGHSLFAAASENPSHLAAIAFGVSAYSLFFSAFQTISAEGQSLWVLYTVPHELGSLLAQKARLWAVLSLAYPLALLGLAVAFGVPPTWQLAGLAALVLIGVPIYSVIATALGVFGCDPLAVDVRRRIRPTYFYLYMLLSSFYAVAIYASDPWARATTMILTVLVALALWQRARDQLPYLLDPTAAPPPRVSIFDGLIAALLFFVLQALAGLVLAEAQQTLSGNALLAVFSIAGAITFLIVRLLYWRAGTEGVPRFFAAGTRWPGAIAWGLGGGLVAALLGLGYLRALTHWDLFAEARTTTLSGLAPGPWLVALAVGAAPPCEEFIFRGLVFGGLRRSMGVGAATLASAAIFALVHPAVSVLPVFALGAIAALAYARTRTLVTPMLVHALYNATVVGVQLLS